MTKILLCGAIWSMVISIFELFFWSIAMLEYYGYFSFFESFPLTAVIKLLYFHNVDVATRYRIGRSIPELPNEAYVLITENFFSSNKTMIYGLFKICASTVWILVSILMITSFSRRMNTHCATLIWGLVTLIFFTCDFLATMFYIHDLQYTKNLVDLVKFIGGILSGAGRVNPETSMAVWTMILIASKGMIGLFINLILNVFSFIHCISPRDEASTTSDNSTFNLRDLSVTERGEDGPDGAGGTGGLGERETQVGQPTIRRGPRFVRRTPEQNRNLLALHHPDLYPRVVENETAVSATPTPTLTTTPTPTLTTTTTPTTIAINTQQPGAGKYSVKFPYSLMSTSQKIEQILKHEHVPSPIPGLKLKKPRKPPLSPVISNSSEDNDVDEVHIEETLPSRKTTQEVNSQKPWSYIPSPMNHMRDQLPADEELPPVPVPDYIVHPSYRKASVHRAQSSLSRELRAKLTNMQERNKSLKAKREKYRAAKASTSMRDADVLY